MVTVGFTILALFTLGFGVISGRIEKSVITPPMIFVRFSLLISPFVMTFLDLNFHREIVDIIATTTLALVLFTDASRIDLNLLRRQYMMPLRLLGIGLPLTILFGTLLATIMFKTLNIWEAAALATILAPTDAALGEAVVSSPQVPLRIRQALNVESGLNDGICLPILLICLSLAEVTGETGTSGYWVNFTLGQVILGPIVGILVGYVGGQIVSVSVRTHWMTENSLGMTRGL